LQSALLEPDLPSSADGEQMDQLLNNCPETDGMFQNEMLFGFSWAFNPVHVQEENVQ
jgi:hypothetical protein